ncbi:addiction module antidote protein [Cupriavidus taiwanensis]|uniref:addiction module antidote protein n=1 Tax=Cupriavidus taiwanensis TaxID=164546 RepID=UPI000E1426DA|nr:addiction module antidote protein [Cupriavidus taiwanensis]SPC05571.1 conserved hypothetical protein [Cupriavidus taiwanensis]
MKEPTRPWDSAAQLRNETEIAAYLSACLAEAGDDDRFIAYALGVVARAHGMTRLARETGLSRESLYRSLSGEGNPEFGTIWKVMRALGIRLHASAG